MNLGRSTRDLYFLPGLSYVADTFARSSSPDVAVDILDTILLPPSVCLLFARLSLLASLGDLRRNYRWRSIILSVYPSSRARVV